MPTARGHNYAGRMGHWCLVASGASDALMACILYRRHLDRRQLLRGSGVKSKIAKTLAQNIASVLSPPTSELVKTHISRKHMYQGEI